MKKEYWTFQFCIWWAIWNVMSNNNSIPRALVLSQFYTFPELIQYICIVLPPSVIYWLLPKKICVSVGSLITCMATCFHASSISIGYLWHWEIMENMELRSFIELVWSLIYYNCTKYFETVHYYQNMKLSNITKIAKQEKD